MAIALQADGPKVPAVSSNGLQALTTGIVDPDKAQQMVQRLFSPQSLQKQDDLLTDWGIRTLSAKEPAFDPESYHNSSIWPHDNWIILKGLKPRPPAPSESGF